jgi:glycosyltransferase involved in cell wall biosynthesis
MTKNKHQRPLFAFVIPTFNEELEIGKTIDSIRENFPGESSQYEIIIADNGSTDRTVEIVRSAGCQYVIDASLTISQLRNLGVEQSSAPVIVFIDADVSLTKSWLNDIGQLRDRLESGERLISGSHYCPDPQNTFFLKSWFAGNYENPSEKFLPGGHTIISRESFVEIGGFSAEYKTGEDVEFCQRASAAGFSIEHDPSIKVIHRGDPKTVGDFLRRERWHGGADFESLSRIADSRPALATIVFGLLHLVFLAGLLIENVAMMLASAASLLALLAVTSFQLFRKSTLLRRLVNILPAYLYFAGRVGSMRTFIKSKSAQ